jgi:hypothetical protein
MRARELILVVADPAVLIPDFCVEGRLLKRLIKARTRPPISNLSYCSFGGILHNLLPYVSWMALIVFSGRGVYLVVTRLTETEWARAFKAVSPGLLPMLGVLFALWVHRSRGLEYFR